LLFKIIFLYENILLLAILSGKFYFNFVEMFMLNVALFIESSFNSKSTDLIMYFVGEVPFKMIDNMLRIQKSVLNYLLLANKFLKISSILKNGCRTL
jgi:hypothetical protein